MWLWSIENKAWFAISHKTSRHRALRRYANLWTWKCVCVAPQRKGTRPDARIEIFSILAEFRVASHASDQSGLSILTRDTCDWVMRQGMGRVACLRLVAHVHLLHNCEQVNASILCRVAEWSSALLRDARSCVILLTRLYTTYSMTFRKVLYAWVSQGSTVICHIDCQLFLVKKAPTIMK